MTDKRKLGFRGKYCTICQQVWELDRTLGREVKYPEMPSFGLERQDCSDCKRTSSGNTDTLPTLAQQVAMKYQKLYVKKQRTK